MSTPQEISSKIRHQAADLLRVKNLHSLLGEMGQLYFTGSYALDLMTWNDIDMQLVLKEGLTAPKALVKIIGCFAHESEFIEGRIIHFSGDYKPQWPRGYCLCLKFNLPNLGGLWKLDLWVLPKEAVDHNQAFMEQLKNALSDHSRELILRIKFELMQSSGRVPKKGSFWLYQAVLFHGLKEKGAILDFLRTKEVPLDEVT
jgi:hypothetical protein